MVRKKKSAFLIAWEKSNFGKINGVDLLNSLYHALVVTIPLQIGLLNADKLPFEGIQDIKIPLALYVWAGFVSFTSAFFGDLIKRINKKLPTPA